MEDELPGLFRFFTDEALDRIIAASGGLPQPEGERRQELADSLEVYAHWLVREVAEEVEQEGQPESVRRMPGRPANKPIGKFLDRLQTVWMTAFDGRLRTSAHHTTGEPGGPLVESLYSCCAELIARLSQAVEAGVLNELTSTAISEALEDRPGGLTKAALRKRVERGAWLNLPDSSVEESDSD